MSGKVTVFQREVRKESYEGLFNTLGDDKIKGTDAIKKKLKAGELSENDFIQNLDTNQDGRFSLKDIDWRRSDFTNFTNLLAAYKKITEAPLKKDPAAVKKISTPTTEPPPSQPPQSKIERAIQWVKKEYPSDIRANKLPRAIGDGSFFAKFERWQKANLKGVLSKDEEKQFGWYIFMQVKGSISSPSFQEKVLKKMSDRDFLGLYSFVEFYGYRDLALTNSLRNEIPRRCEPLILSSVDLFDQSSIRVLRASQLKDDSQPGKEILYQVEIMVKPKKGNSVRLVLFPNRKEGYRHDGSGRVLSHYKVKAANGKEYLIPPSVFERLVEEARSPTRRGASEWLQIASVKNRANITFLMGAAEQLFHDLS